MKLVAFWLLKYGFALSFWYGMDDRLAAHFSTAALGNVPLILAFSLVLLVSVCSEQYSVVRAYEVGRS
jgi:hypothetical protein